MKFSVVGIQHPHIYGMTSELVAHGAELVSAYDSDKTALDAFVKKYRGVKAARCEEEILEDKNVRLVAGAAVTSERADIGIRTMNAGKDYFTDKGPFTSFEQ